VSGLKEIARRVGLGVLGTGLRRVPPAAWPAWGGDAFWIKVPANVRPQPRSPAGGANVNIVLDLLDRALAFDGDIAECGVFRGATLIPIGLVLAQRAPDRTAWGFDSFQGFDATVEVDLALGGAEDAEKRRGGFDGTSQAQVEMRLRALGLGDRVRLVPGYFEQTLPRQPERRYCFVHLDCDLYGSYQTCLEHFHPRLAEGGIILLDEYDDPPWPGCNKAVDEFLAAHADMSLHRIERDGFEKAYLVKAR
jgi:hypothetical protein